MNLVLNQPLTTFWTNCNFKGALHKILGIVDQIGGTLQQEAQVLGELEERLLAENGSTQQLELLQQDVFRFELKSIEPDLRELEGVLAETGDVEPRTSVLPLRNLDAELHKRLVAIEQSARRTIESRRATREGNSNLLARAELIKQRLSELESQLGILSTVSSALDPETLADRLEELRQVQNKVGHSFLNPCITLIVIIDCCIQQLNGCEGDVTVLRSDSTEIHGDLSPQLQHLLEDLEEKSSRLNRLAVQAIADVEPQLLVVEKFASKQEILANNIAAARKATPIRPNK